MGTGTDSTQQTDGQNLYQQASQSHQPEVVVKRQFTQRSQNQKTKLANEFIKTAGREGVSRLSATLDGQRALAVVYDHAGRERVLKAFLHQIHWMNIILKKRR